MMKTEILHNGQRKLTIFDMGNIAGLAIQVIILASKLIVMVL
nr:MAG TPA: hypothetical protein [Bacteriophage sp.]